VRRAIDGPLTTAVPASFLQVHPSVTWLLDEAAAHELAPASRQEAGTGQVS